MTEISREGLRVSTLNVTYATSDMQADGLVVQVVKCYEVRSMRSGAGEREGEGTERENFHHVLGIACLILMTIEK